MKAEYFYLSSCRSCYIGELYNYETMQKWEITEKPCHIGGFICKEMVTKKTKDTRQR